MTIGQKLRAARDRAGLTQESAAEALGVSRQTLSSWENDRSYPDIAATITLSGLYGLTLDELLKEDIAMIQHLNDAADTVKSHKTLTRRILIMAYLLIWAFSVGFFWVAAGPTDAMGYSLLFFYLILPVAAMVVSFFIGRDEEWQGIRWLMLLFFGVMNMLAPYATFSLANISFTGKFHLFRLTDMLPGILYSAAGMLAGYAVDRLTWKKGSSPMGEHRFAVLEAPPRPGERWKRTGWKKYSCVAVHDDYLADVREDLQKLPVYLESIEEAGEGLEECGIELIPPESIPALLQALEEKEGFGELRPLLRRAQKEGKFVIHFGL